MQPVAQPRVKICCISSAAEAAMAVEAGASALGLVSAMPSGPGVIDEPLIARLAAAAPPGVATFLLTCCQRAGGIIDQQRRLGTNAVQICDHLVDGDYAQLREGLPGVKLVQVVHVSGEASIDEAARVAEQVDAILLDSGNQRLAVTELGGTGRRHDWSISRRIRETVERPVYLAGGLNAGNVRAAIDEVSPFGVDVCSGVRTNGRLDPTKLAAFMAATRRGRE
jgi:phosphoribosylanthranilate isomerase